MTARGAAAAALPDLESLWTIDELAAEVGSTVRTLRYYATLGLLPPPQRLGRLAYYDERHRARLDLVRTMQEQGLSLSAIEQHLSALDPEAPASEIEMRRALFASWAPVPAELADRAGLETRAGRSLTDDDVETLQRLGTIRPVDGGFECGPTLKVGVELLDLGLPLDGVEAAGRAIRAHMDALVLELREIMDRQVLVPLKKSGADPDAFAATMGRLRQLTLDAVVGNFQQAANGLLDAPRPERLEKEA